MIRSHASRRDGVRLEVLGRIALRSGDDELRAVLVQPKRFALLVYAALRRPGGYVRRDELLGALWPESGEARARAALRQALRFLRGEMGAGIVVNRGAADFGVSPLLSCDALEFLRALERGDDAAAVTRYGGDLLPGFLLDGVPGFESWLDGERARMRRLAAEAALRLADRADAEGDSPGAAEFVRSALHIEPSDEAAARRLRALVPQHARPTGRALSAQRVLVLELANHTGDAELDPLGWLTADALAQGLSTIADLEVVPPLAVGPTAASGAAIEGAETSRANAPPLPQAGLELARQTGAGTVVSGAIHRDGDTLRFLVRLTDVGRGRLLPGPEPVLAARATPLDGVEQLREQVMTTLGPALTRRAVHVRPAARPPGMDAFRAYLDGLELFIGAEWERALAEFRRSAELEPGYALPRIVAAIALWNLGRLPDADAAAGDASRLRHTLGRFERAVLDMVRAWLHGDWAEARRASALQADLAPGSIPHFQVAEEARRLNRPREARDVLTRLDPDTGELRGWIFYWVERATAHHLLGDHEAELELVARCRRAHPDDAATALLEVRALAALGRDDELARVLEGLLSRRTTTLVPGWIAVEAALELRAHGRPEAAAPILDRAVAWYRDKAGPDPPESLRRALARALYYAGRLDDARALFLQLAATAGRGVQPVGYHHPQLQAHLDAGYLAVIAAQQGDAAESTRWCAWLQDLDAPFLYGAQWFWLAAVHAVLGNPQRAVSSLHRAFADGMSMEMFLHTDPHLARLAGIPRFDALMQPRG